METLALILARGGSKRIPRKNIRNLGGQPLICYIISAAKSSKHINRIIVSTDDSEIAEVSKDCGAEVPFLRSSEISKDDSKEIDAFKQCLKWLKENEDYVPDLIVKLFPTAPFLKSESIDKAVELMIANPQADSVRSVRPCSEHPYKMWVIENDLLKPFVPWENRPEESHTFSYQSLPKVYIQNAAVDVTKPSTIWEKNSVTGKKILAFLMENREESLDINTPLDFVFAEDLIRIRSKSK